MSNKINVCAIIVVILIKIIYYFMLSWLLAIAVKIMTPERPPQCRKWKNTQLFPFLSKQSMKISQTASHFTPLTHSNYLKYRTEETKDRWGWKTQSHCTPVTLRAGVKRRGVLRLTDLSLHHKLVLKVTNLDALQSFTLLHTCKKTTACSYWVLKE